MSQLTNYVQKELKKGFSKELIMKKLLQAGYTQEEISETFASLQAAEPVMQRKPVEKVREHKHVRWGSIVFPLLALALLVFFGFMVYTYVEIPTFPEVVEEKEVPVGCEGITENRERDICYLQMAATGAEVCDEFVNAAFQHACLSKLWEADQCLYLEMIEQVSEECEVPLAEGDCHAQEDYRTCINALALEEMDPTLCKGNDECIAPLAIALQDGSLCEKHAIGGVDTCVQQYYDATNDATYCNPILLECGFDEDASEAAKRAFIEQRIQGVEDDIYTSYLLTFGRDFGEPLICSYMKSSDILADPLLTPYDITLTDFCLMVVAYHTEDAAICSQLTETHKNTLCLDMFNCPVAGKEDLCDAI